MTRRAGLGSPASRRVALLWHCVLMLSGAVSALAQADRRDTDYIHVLKAGESIWSVAQTHLANPRDWRRLQIYNKLHKERQLPPGTRVAVPLDWMRRIPIPVEVVSVTGRAHWTRTKETVARAVVAGTLLHSGDRIRLEDRSHVRLKLPDGSEVEVSPLSELTLQAHRYASTPATYISFHLLQGRAESRVLKREHPASRFEVTTPTAQLGVRGTQFRASVPGRLDRSIAEVEEGVIAASNPSLPNATRVTLYEGFATIVRAGQAPLAPVAMLAAPDIRPLAGLELGSAVEYAFVPVSGAVVYRIQLIQAQPGGNAVFERVMTAPRFAFSQLPEGEYQLRARAIDDLGIEGREARIQFSVREIGL